jgi:hypothetical protein
VTLKVTMSENGHDRRPLRRGLSRIKRRVSFAH